MISVAVTICWKVNFLVNTVNPLMDYYFLG